MGMCKKLEENPEELVFSLQVGLFDHTMVTNLANAELNHLKPGLGAKEFTAISFTSQGASLEPLYLYFSTNGLKKSCQRAVMTPST